MFEEIDRPGAGALHELVEGGAEDYEVDDATGIVTFAVAPPTGSYAQVDYESQGEMVTRSETMLVEYGTLIEETETLIVEFIA